MRAWSEYPSSTFFILANEFCERFSFYGMKALLTVYLVTEHHFIPSTAVFLYHLFSCIAFISPLFGSVAADSYFGRYKVILYVSIFYVCGHALLSFGALPWLEYQYRSFFDFSGLLIIAVSTGGIKPCVSAFAVDQFAEDQPLLRAQFFSFFYFSINAGALLAIVSTPILKSKIGCFGATTCFPLAFGVPGVLMLLALLIFIAGSRSYKKLPPSGSNVAFELAACAITAVRKRSRGEKIPENGDWISLAAPEHKGSTMRSLRSFVDVACIFAPIVLFWALFDQKGSTWILLARKLNYRFGTVNVIPEQINFLNPLLILILVPIFEGIVYPLARKVVDVTPLRKMTVGGFLTALSFVMCGLIELEADKDQPVMLNSNEYLIRYMENQTFSPSIPEGVYGKEIFRKEFNKIGLEGEGGQGIILNTVDDEIFACNFSNVKTIDGAAKLIFLSGEDGINLTIRSNKEIIKSGHFKQCEAVDIINGANEISFEWKCNQTAPCVSRTISTGIGSVQAIQIIGGEIASKTLVESNKLSIAWMFPQYVVITMGEVMLSVTGLEFAYSQATPSMKSVMQALWLMTVFLGNIIDAIISGSHFVASAANEFFLYAALMVLVMLFFMYSATSYTYHNHEEEHSIEETDHFEMNCIEKRS